MLDGALLVALAVGDSIGYSQQASSLIEQFRQRSRTAEQNGLAEPFKGIAASSGIQAGLFSIKSTGVSTEPVRKAAEAFLAVSRPAERDWTVFGVDDPEWRKWMNQHFYMRQGVSFLEMTERQREAGFDLLRAAFSARGLKQTRDIMRLNETLGELNGNDFEQYGEWRYHITVMGHAIRHRAVGLAVRWPPRNHQLFRPRRSGGDDAPSSPDRSR